VQSDGSPLPNARLLTLTLFQNISNVCDRKHNELLVPWGQFIAHDLAYTPVNSVNSSFPGSYTEWLLSSFYYALYHKFSKLKSQLSRSLGDLGCFNGLKKTFSFSIIQIILC